MKLKDCFSPRQRFQILYKLIMKDELERQCTLTFLSAISQEGDEVRTPEEEHHTSENIASEWESALMMTTLLFLKASIDKEEVKYS